MDAICETKGLSEFGCSLVSYGLYFVYFLVIVALITSIVLPLISALKNPKVLVKLGISVGVLLAVFLVGFAISSDEVSRIGVAKGISPTESKVIGAGFITFYIALIVAALSLIYSEVSKAFK